MFHLHFLQNGISLQFAKAKSSSMKKRDASHILIMLILKFIKCSLMFSAQSRQKFIRALIFCFCFVIVPKFVIYVNIQFEKSQHTLEVNEWFYGNLCTWKTDLISSNYITTELM